MDTVLKLTFVLFKFFISYYFWCLLLNKIDLYTNYLFDSYLDILKRFTLFISKM